jgi:hypothetical protein
MKPGATCRRRRTDVIDPVSLIMAAFAAVDPAELSPRERAAQAAVREEIREAAERAARNRARAAAAR